MDVHDKVSFTGPTYTLTEIMLFFSEICMYL